MFKMFAQMFETIRTFFMAAHHLAEWAEESAASFAEEARLERQAKAQAKLKELRGKEQPKLEAPTTKKLKVAA
jgi:DNA-directed RNA polymerase